VRFSRRYNAQTQVPHTTYFQTPEPPKPRRQIFTRLLSGTGFILLGAYAHSWLYDLPFLGWGLDELDSSDDVARVEEAFSEGLYAALAKVAMPLDLEVAQSLLETRASYSVTPSTIAHTSQLPSNAICEDTFSSGVYNLHPQDQDKDWCEWAIFDGHAGPCTAALLKNILATEVGMALLQQRCFERPYIPNDPAIQQTIKKSFQSIDDRIIQTAANAIRDASAQKATIVAETTVASSGSCALLSLYDPKSQVLRVANVGDSRAVLGRWDDEGQRYIAQALSDDQTGYNANELERLQREHPGEDVVKDGRIHGIAVSRAFGDARWKFPQELSKRAHDMFWGPNPRPDSMIKTPPYLTAEPEITETKVHTGAHPDFLILASDGLWDQMTNEDAVTCVQMWLDRNKPTDIHERIMKEETESAAVLAARNPMSMNRELFGRLVPSFSSVSDVAKEEDDIYFDEKEQCLRWRVSPKHFVVEDDNCGVHLIKNALGGNRRDLFTGVMSVRPPLSRDVRDDITVHVVFFGVDGASLQQSMNVRNA
jgi:pyruvate dehydrogenase phosphatase